MVIFKKCCSIYYDGLKVTRKVIFYTGKIKQAKVIVLYGILLKYSGGGAFANSLQTQELYAYTPSSAAFPGAS